MVHIQTLNYRHDSVLVDAFVPRSKVLQRKCIINQETMKCARENSCKQVARTAAQPVNHSNETNGNLNATSIKMEGSYSHSPSRLVIRTLVLLIFVAFRGKKCDKMYFTPFYNSTLDFAIHFTEFNSKFCATVQQNFLPTINTEL